MSALSAIDAAIWTLGQDGYTTEELCKARSAFVELIEADRQHDKARRAWDDGVYTRWDGISDASRMKVADDFQDSIARRATALARVQDDPQQPMTRDQEAEQANVRG